MCSRPFETRSLPSSLAATHRDFAFYVAFPKAPFDLSVFPSMSLASTRLPFTLSARELAKDRFGEPPKPGRRGDRSREFAAIPNHDDFVKECLEPATAGKLIFD
jgi:hypothetical protein